MYGQTLSFSSSDSFLAFAVNVFELTVISILGLLTKFVIPTWV